MAKNFAITGVGGYVAERHLAAIRDTNNNLVAAVDPSDSVGIIDRYFREVSFFTEFERFDRHLEKLRRKDPDHRIDYLSICSPNYLHDAHVRFAMRIGANAICEKPLVLNPWNLDALAELEREHDRKVNTVLQLRVHPALIELRKKMRSDKSGHKKQVVLTYVTPRGAWYRVSWKGQLERSGGLATNIGIHFFDLLIWLFGPVQSSEVHLEQFDKTGGFIELANADVRWYLSIDRNDLPAGFEANEKQPSSFRSITIDGDEVEFSKVFNDLHKLVYEKTLAGEGFGLEDARPSISLAHDIRVANVAGRNERSHDLVK